MDELPEDEHQAQLDQARRRKRLLQAAGLVAAVIVAVAFVVENSQPVKVRFWFVSAHPRLIWVVIACLVAGALFGLVLGRQSRRRARRRRRGPAEG